MTKGTRVLIIDDEESILINLERTLEDAGYSTTTACSREEVGPGALRCAAGR